MTSDVMNMCEDVSPVYILPGDPPDVKPDLATLHPNDVSQRWLVCGPSAADGPLHLKAELTEIKVEYEQEDVLASPSTITDGPLHMKPELTEIKVEDEQEDLLASPATITDPDSQSNGLSSRGCTGELQKAPKELQNGLIDVKCESDSESAAHSRHEGTRPATPQAHTTADKELASRNMREEPSSARQRRFHRCLPLLERKKSYKCDDCGSMFSMAVSLKIHRRIHGREIRYRRNFRGTASSTVAQNMLAPTYEKPFKCGYCDRTFAHASELGRHIHSSVWRYVDHGSQEKSNRLSSRDDQSHGLSSQECTGEELRNAAMELRDGLIDGKCESVSEPVDHSWPETTHTAPAQAHTNADKGIVSPGICTEESSLRPRRIGRRMYTSKKTYKCDDCGAVFSWAGGRESHRRMHEFDKRNKGSHDQSSGLNSLDDQWNGLSSQECTGELRNAPMELRDGFTGVKCESVSETIDCPRPETTHKATTQAHTNTDKGVLSRDICKEQEAPSSRSRRRRRTSKKAFKCDDCGAVFSWAGGLSSHRRVHKREKTNKGSHDQSKRLSSLDDQSNRLSSQECTGEKLRNAPMELQDGLIDGKCESVSEPADCSRPETTHTATTQAHTNEGKGLLNPGMCKEESSSRPRQSGRRGYTSRKTYKCDDCGAVFSWAGGRESHRRMHEFDKRNRGSHDQSKRLLANQSDGLSSQECTGELRNAPMKLWDGLTGVKCESVSESPTCCETTLTGTTQAYTNTDKGVLSPGMCKEESSSRPRQSGRRGYKSWKTYKCDDCGAVFSWSVGLRNHRRVHKREKANKGSHDQSDGLSSLDDQSHGLVSQECTGEELRNAPVELRDGLTDVKCESVSESPTCSRHETTHTATTEAHTNEGKGVLSPGICKEEPSSRPRHSNFPIRRNKIAYNCDDCVAVFAWAGGLASHRRMHKRERRSYLHMGNAHGATLDTVAQNKLTHAYERPYKCGYCDQTFARATELGTHMRPGFYECVDCGKSFVRRCSLALHRPGEKCVFATRDKAWYTGI